MRRRRTSAVVTDHRGARAQGLKADFSTLPTRFSERCVQCRGFHVDRGTQASASTEATPYAAYQELAAFRHSFTLLMFLTPSDSSHCRNAAAPPLA